MIPESKVSRKRRLPGALFAVLILVFCVNGCVSSYRSKKIPVTFRRAPLAKNLDRKTLLIGPFIQKSPGFQAGTDIKQMIQRKCQQQEVFNNLIYSSADMEWEDDIPMKERLEDYKSTDWVNLYDGQAADYLVTGLVRFTSRDRSGYDTDLVTNRYGYTYTRRVYKDRMTYTFELAMLLIDLNTGEIIAEKVFKENDESTGGADGMSIFFELAASKIEECMDAIQGPKIRTKRYLLYN